MNRAIRAVIALGLAALVARVSAFGATLGGTVQTVGGDGIAATVSVLYKTQGVSIEVHETDEDGSFSIEIGSGAVAVAATATDYSSDEINLSNGVPSRARFTLRPLRFYRGTVTGSNGRTVSGASVRVRNVDTSRSIHIDSHSTDVTDGDGEFVVAVPEGSSERFVADIEAEGWVPQSTDVLGTGAVGGTGAADGPSESVRIILESRGASVRGTVTSPSGSALSGITVLVSVAVSHARTIDAAAPGGIAGPGTGEIRPYGSTFRARTVTDSGGRYEVSGLPSGRLGVVAIKRGITMQPRRFDAAEGGEYEAGFVIPD